MWLQLTQQFRLLGQLGLQPGPGSGPAGGAELRPLRALARGTELSRSGRQRWRIQPQRTGDQRVLSSVQGRSDCLQGTAPGKAGPIAAAVRAGLRAAAALGEVHARAWNLRSSRPQARPAPGARLARDRGHRNADGRRRLLGRDSGHGQRPLGRVRAPVDRVRRIPRWTWGVGRDEITQADSPSLSPARCGSGVGGRRVAARHAGERWMLIERRVEFDHRRTDRRCQL